MATRITSQSDIRHTRLVFTPLTWGCQLEVLTPDSPAMQLYSTVAATYTPDREVSPCAIRPTLTLVDQDGVYESGVRNDMLAKSKHQWQVDGEDIGDVWTEGTDYDVATSDNNYLNTYNSDYNGTLYVYRNFSVGNAVQLRYTGMFNDGRTGYNQAVMSDTLALTSTDSGVEEMGLLLSATEIVYNPLNDKHLLYDYLTGIGVDADSDYEDGAQYDRSVTIQMTLGGEPLDELADGCALSIIDHATGEELDDEAFEWDGSQTLSMDLRMVEDTSLEVQLLYGGQVMATQKLDVYYEMPAADSMTMSNLADIPVALEDWSNSAVIVAGKQKVEYPECYYDITWHVTPRVQSGSSYAYGTQSVLGHGESVSCAVYEDLGLQKTASELSWCLVTYTAAQRAVCAVLADDDGDSLTDEDGNMLID